LELDRIDADITGSDANRLFDGDNKYLSIAYAAGLRAFLDRQNRFAPIADGDGLGEQIQR
jgi:hypothetical protein